MTERFNHSCDTLLAVIELARSEGFTTEFATNDKGFFDPESGKTYLPESIAKVEVIRVDAPFSEPDAQSIVYFMETVDGQKGWISDAYGLYADANLAEHLNRIKANFKCPA